MTIRVTTTEEAAATEAAFDRAHAGRREPRRPAELLAELFDRQAAMVLGLCRSLLRNAHDAEDAAQQTFLSAYRSLLGGTRPRDPGAWIATIARNECRSRAQRRMREPLPLAESTNMAPVTPAEAADVEALRVALAQLPGQQRQAFVLREFSGLSYDELAAVLGVTVPAVESLLFRARRRLRASLRSTAAAALSFPAAMRDLVVQLFGSSPDGAGPATLAKLGSAPLLAKLASAGAGAALVTAGAVAIVPARHHQRLTMGPRVAARARPAPSRPALTAPRGKPTALVAKPIVRPAQRVSTPASKTEHETAPEARPGRTEIDRGDKRDVSVAPQTSDRNRREAVSPPAETSPESPGASSTGGGSDGPGAESDGGPSPVSGAGDSGDSSG